MENLGITEWMLWIIILIVFVLLLRKFGKWLIR